MICGIDNGLDGGIVIISATTGAIIAKRPMPTRWRHQNEIRPESTTKPKDLPKSKREVDVEVARDWITGATGDNAMACQFVLEEPGGSKSVSAAKSMAASFHAVRALFEVKGWAWEAITPRRWQKVMLGKSFDNTKDAALDAARKVWPDEMWQKNARCKVAHDGMVDAALIAIYTFVLSNENARWIATAHQKI